MTDQEVTEIVIPKLEIVFKETTQKILEIAAPLLGQLSRKQLQVVSKHFGGGYINSDRLQRLAAFGRGELPEYLSIKDKTLPYTTWVRLKKDIKSQIRDPHKVTDLLSYSDPQSYTSKVELQDLTRFDWKIVLDEEFGLRDLERQKKFYAQNFNDSMKGVYKPPKEEYNKEVEVYKNLIISKKPGFVVMTSEHYAIEFNLKTMRKLLRDYAIFSFSGKAIDEPVSV